MTSNSQTALRWVVGVDLHGRSGGAVAFARWLVARTGDPVVGTHVFGEALLDGADPSVDVAQLGKLFDAALAPLRGDASFSDLGLHPARTVIEGLAQVADEKQADALVVGRIKRSDREALSRLGRVARRLLRALPRPVVVVPPDLEADRIGDGPIVLATDCTDGSVGAARFATRLGEHLRLPIHVVHVVPLPSDYQALMPAPQLRTVSIDSPPAPPRRSIDGRRSTSRPLLASVPRSGRSSSRSSTPCASPTPPCSSSEPTTAGPRCDCSCPAWPARWPPRRRFPSPWFLRTTTSPRSSAPTLRSFRKRGVNRPVAWHDATLG